MDGMFDSMTHLMDSRWFFPVVVLLVLLALAPLVATRVLAHREERRTYQPRTREGDGDDT